MASDLATTPSTGEIWPTKASAHWPPKISFGDDGEVPLQRFVRRFSYGENLLQPHYFTEARTPRAPTMIPLMLMSTLYLPTTSDEVARW